MPDREHNPIKGPEEWSNTRLHARVSALESIVKGWEEGIVVILAEAYRKIEDLQDQIADIHRNANGD